MLFGKIVVIKRSGADGAQFPLTTSSCLFGRSNDCDIRIQLPNVSREHCRVSVVDNGEVYLTNLSTVNPIRVNEKFIESTIELAHGDVFTIIDRSFRFEVPTLIGKSPAKSPGKHAKNFLITPVKNSPNKGYASPKNVDLNETYPLKPLSPSNRKSLGGTSAKKQTGLRTLTPQPAKPSKPMTPRNNSTPADMKRTMKILTPKSKPPTPVIDQTEGSVQDKTPKKKRVQSPSPIRSTKQKGHVSRAETKGMKSPTVVKTPKVSPKRDARTPKSVSRSPVKNGTQEDKGLQTKTKSPARLLQKEVAQEKTPAKSPSLNVTKIQTSKSPSRTPVKTKDADLSSRSPAQNVSGIVKSPRTKTPSKSPARKSKTEDIAATTPSKTKFSGVKTTDARSASKSPSRKESNTPAKVKAATSSQTGVDPVKTPRANTPARIPSLTQKISPRTKSPVQSLQRTSSHTEVAQAKTKNSNTPKRLKSPDRLPSPARSPSPSKGATKVPAGSGSPTSKTQDRSGFDINTSGELPTKSAIAAEDKTDGKTSRKSRSPASKTPSPRATSKTPPRASTGTKSPSGTPSSAKAPRGRSPSKSPTKQSPKSVTPLPAKSKSPVTKTTETAVILNLPSTSTPVVSKQSVKVKSGGKRKSTGDNAPSAKKKRISFGPQLSPEMFDKKLPPITPVRRGTTPRRLSEPLNVLSPKSLLKRKSVSTFRAQLTITEESPKKITPEKNSKTPKRRNSKLSPGTRSPKPTPGKRSPKQGPKSPVSTPKNRSPASRSPKMESSIQSTSPARSPGKKSPQGNSPKQMTLSPRSPVRKSPKVASPKQSTSPARSPAKKSSQMNSPKQLTLSPRSPVRKSPKVASPVLSTSLAVKKSPKVAIPKQSTSPTSSSVKKSTKKASPKRLPTPRRSPKSVNRRHAKTNDAEISFTGLQEMMKTPKVATSTPKATKSPKGKSRRASTGAVNFAGVKNLLKTPKNKLDDVSFTGLSLIMQTPKSEIKHQNRVKPGRTPTPRRTPKSLKKTPKSKNTPKLAIKNAVAIRAIHGKARTPKLPTNLWSDIVKTGIAEKGIAKRQSSGKLMKVVQKRGKTPKSVKKKMPPKTPRTKAASKAPTTGHIASPATIVIRKKQIATPAPLPRKGRKSMGLMKVQPRLGARLSGVADMFKTPSPANTPELSGTPHSLYSDLPETPVGPGEMIVSPMSSSKRKSVPTPKLAGLKNLFKETKIRSDMKLNGVKQLMKTPKQSKSPGSPLGIGDLFKTPKSATPNGKSAKKTNDLPANSPSPKVTSGRKSSAKKSPVKKSPVARGGRKRPAPVFQEEVEVPSKRSRDVLIKKSQVKSAKKAIPVKPRKKTVQCSIPDDKENLVDAVSTDIRKPTQRKALPKLKTSPKNLKSRDTKNKSPKTDVKRKTRRGKVESPVKTVEDKVITPRKSAKIDKKVPANKPGGNRTSRRGKVAVVEPVVTPMKSVEQKPAVNKSGKKGKASSPVKNVTKTATRTSPTKSTPIKQLPSVKKLVAKRSTRGKPVEEVVQTKLVVQKTPTKKVVKSPLKKASPKNRKTRGKGKKQESPLKVEKEALSIHKKNSSPMKKPVRAGKRKRSVSPASVEPPSKKPTQVNEMSQVESPVKLSSNKKQTRGKKAKKEVSPKKMATSKLQEKKVVRRQVEKSEGKIVSPSKTPAKRTTRGKAAKILTPKKVALQTEEPKVSTLKKETNPKKTPVKRGTRGKLAKVEKPVQSPINEKGKKNTPVKRTTRGKASKGLSPTEKTPSKRTKKSTGLKKSPTIQLTPVKTTKKTTPAKKVSKIQKASPAKPVQAESTGSPRKTDTPVKRTTRKGGKRKATPTKVTSPPKMSKNVEKSAEHQPIEKSPAKALKKSTRGNPKAKTPVKVQKKSVVSPKQLKGKVLKKTVSPKSKTPTKRVTRARK